jgi:DnaD/phage-associated family protein
MTFSGFPSGRLAQTPLPDLLFSELIPQVDDLGELKVTLHILWLLYHKTDSPRYVTLQELLADSTLVRSVGALTPSPKAAIEAGLQKAVSRGTLLHLRSPDGQNHFYLLNSPQGRRAAERVELGELQLRGSQAQPEAAVPAARPNIFVLYEQNIGLLQPIIAEELQDAERTYSPEWIEDAFRLAVENNVRNWKYIRRILERWAVEGRGDGTGTQARSRGGDKARDKTWYTEEESRKYIQR